MNKFKILLLIMSMLIITGCQECTQSHREETTCVVVSCINTQYATSCIPIPVSCTQTVCDKYEEID